MKIGGCANAWTEKQLFVVSFGAAVLALLDVRFCCILTTQVVQNRYTVQKCRLVSDSRVFKQSFSSFQVPSSGVLSIHTDVVAFNIQELLGSLWATSY